LGLAGPAGRRRGRRAAGKLGPAAIHRAAVRPAAGRPGRPAGPRWIPMGRSALAANLRTPQHLPALDWVAMGWAAAMSSAEADSRETDLAEPDLPRMDLSALGSTEIGSLAMGSVETAAWRRGAGKPGRPFQPRRAAAHIPDNWLAALPTALAAPGKTTARRSSCQRPMASSWGAWGAARARRRMAIGQLRKGIAALRHPRLNASWDSPIAQRTRAACKRCRQALIRRQVSRRRLARPDELGRSSGSLAKEKASYQRATCAGWYFGGCEGTVGAWKPIGQLPEIWPTTRSY
jgi:hypothetical protein